MHHFLVSSRLGRWLAVAVLALLAAPAAQAQLSGAKAIPGDYATVAAAITALNAQGVGAGGVTFNIAAGYTETFGSPTAGAITATGTAANPVVFQKSGAGANPKITAGVGTAALDAIISLSGSDYVTFDGLELAESAANTTAVTQMEFGFALFRANTAGTDGCQNNIIRNCVVTLNKTNAGTIGIYGAPNASASATAVTATAATGANSSNRVYGNVVTNALTGIYFAASSTTTVANYDQNNEIGSIVSPATTATGNTVGNFGGAASGYGAGGTYQNGLKVQGNTLNSTLDYTSATTSTSVAASTVTSTLRGIYTPVGVSSNLNITGNSITLASGATSSTMYGLDNGMGSTPAGNTVNISNNTIALTYTLAVTSGTLYAINNAGGPATLNITGNTVSGITQGGTGAVYAISNSHTATTANVSNNTTTNVTRTGASGSFYGYANTGSGGGTENLTNNSWSNISVATTSSVYGIYNVSSSSENQQWSGNTVTGITNTSTGSLYGLYCAYGSAASAFFNNTVTNLSGGGTTGGIYLPNTSLAQVAVYGNTVGSVSTSAAASSVYGIYTTVPTASIYRNKVYGISGTSTGGVAYGIYTSTGTTVSIYNNLVGNLTAPASTNLLAVAGINVASGTTVSVYYNTIYLNASSSGVSFGTSGVYLGSTTPVLDLRDNIIVNTSTAAGTGGYTAAFRRTSGTAGTVPANYATTSNNNLLYAGPPSATNLLYVEGTTAATNAQQTLAAYKAFMANRDQASVTENPPFASTTGSASSYLHIAAGTPTQVESGGTAVSGITTDYDGDPRNASFPDLGADEGTFTSQDLTGPNIALAPLGNTGSTASRTLTVTISDPSGVSTATPPRLFYRKGTSGAFTSVLATSSSGSIYTFTIDYAALGGVVVADVVQYYVVAQDAPGNVATNPAGGTYATAPTSPYQYTVLTALSGVYYVGTSTSPVPARTYATLTAAAAAYNSNGLGGAVTFLLLDPTYSAATGETFPIGLLNNPDASATNTLTIKPNTGVSSTITGANSLLAFQNARYVTLDGSNGGGTPAGTSRDLILTSTSTTSGAYHVFVLSPTNSAGTTNLTVRNLSIVGGSAITSGVFGIVAQGPDNDNLTVQNNSVVGVTTGIQLNGAASGTTAVSAGGNDNLQVLGNVVGPATSAAAANIGTTALYVGNAVNATVTGNTLQNVTSASQPNGLVVAGVAGGTLSGNTVRALLNTSSGFAVGINLTTGTTGVVLDANRVSGVTGAGSGGYGGYGIRVATGLPTSSVRVSNNFVSDIQGTSYTSLTGGASVGLLLTSTMSGVNLAYNSVNLTGTYNYSAGFSVAFGIDASVTGIGAVDNIFANSQVNSAGAGNAYAFYSTAPASAYTTLDYNDYYSAGTQATLAYFGGANQLTLATLRTATGQDAHSLSADPQFASATDLHSASAVLNNAGVPVSGISTDIDGDARSATTPDIGADEFSPPACQAVTGLAFASITPTSASITFTAPTGGAAANSYTVTYTPAGGTATTVTPNPTGSPVALSGLTANTAYTVTVTTNCTGATSPSATGTFRTACAPPTYAALPATETFEGTWLSRCDTREVPTANWLNTPTTGNNSWRRDDDGASANWTSPTGGSFTPAGSQGSAHAARFHAYFASSGAVGTLDYYVDLSTAGTKRLTFDYVNASTGGSKVDVLLSTDGGATFAATPLLSVTTSAAFSTKTVDLTAASATSVLRFRATSDFGSYDIGVDNVSVALVPAIDLAATALATPTATQGCYGSAEAVAVTVTNQGTQALDFSVNPATVTATVATPGGPQTLTGSIVSGTLAAGATQNVTLTPTLNMTAAGTYTFAISATVTGDGNPANDALAPAPTRTVAAPVAGTLAPAATTICVSGTASLTLTGAANGSIQYQSSPDNVTFADVAGATSAAYTTPVLTSTTYYRAQVRCGTTVATSNVSTVTVNNPQVAGTNTPVSICAGSAATLTASASAGSSVRFFDVATGGTALATATPGSYTTPALTASATYYAEAYSGGGETVGRTAPTVTTGFLTTDYGLVFSTTGAVKLQSAVIYPVGTGTITFALVNAAGTELAATPALSVTGSGATTPVTVPLNLTAPAAGTSYRLVVKAYTGLTDLLRENPLPTGSAYPFSSPSGVLSFTNGYLSGTLSTTAYYYFYNVAISTECVGGAARTAIQVNVTPPATASFAAATASSCGTSAFPLTGTVGGSATGGTYSSSGTGTFAPNASTLAATYTPSAADVAAGTVTLTLTSSGSTPCPAATATQTLSLSPAPVASFSYPAATTYCAGSAGTVAPTLGSGATAGTFSSTTAGLTIDATTGVITLSSSTAGTYTVTNTVAASGACAATSATATVTITPATSAAFGYGGGTFCVSGTNPAATVTGTAGGTFSSTTGLSLNASTGAIALSTSTPGTYTVTYTVAGPCGSSSTQSVTITTAPSATFSYGAASTFCVSGATNPTPSFGTGASGGVFSSTAGLTIDPTTGVITLASSTPGTYTVTNTIAASGGCAAASATAQVTITAAPTAAFSYGATSTYCVSGATNPAVVLSTGATAGTFSSTTGLTLNATTGAVTLSSSTPGTYTVTNTVAAANGCAATTATATVTITAAPRAVFSYGTVSTYCVSGTTAPTVVLGTGATAGTFSSTTGLTINASTGAITLSTSTPGTYTVTNTVAAAGGCAAVTATTQVTITAAPTAAFSYATASGCVGGTGTAAPTLGTGATAGTFSSTAGLTINATTGVITLSSSTAGTYTVTNTVAAAGGCAAATATATFTVNPRPATPTISAAYNGAVTTLTSSAATGNQWYLNGVAIAGATNPTYVVNGTPAQLGSYTVTTTNANGCVSLASNPLVVTGTKTGLAGASLRLYPNPTPSGQVTLELTGYRSATQLTVLDALGRVVTHELLPANAGTATHVLDLSGAATGVYLLRLSNADGVETRRLVRE